MASSGSKKVLFICLGNICRSPIAEAVFNHVLKERGMEGWDIDSAGIGNWHAGNSPDHRAIACMKEHGVAMKHYARQIKKTDFNYYDYIFGCDHENINDLNRLAPKDSKAKIDLFGSFDPEKELIIDDPYYDDGDEGFEKCYIQCLRCSNGFLDTLNS